MALTMQKTWATLHMLVRILALTGLVVVIVGLVLWLSLEDQENGRLVTVAGAALVGLGVLLEIPGFLRQMTSRRGAMGANVIIQVALAAALLVGANYVSFQRYHRFDLTWDQSFTLEEDLRTQLAQLRGDTDIVVLQRHLSFGQTGDNKQDHYDVAAERKIVQKVKDLAELFEDFGSRFRVTVLDAHDQEYHDRLNKIREQSPVLATAIEKAPENSIFFHADGKVQRLAFHDVYQLDREASVKANGDRGNLVLHFQGVDPLASKVLNIAEKQPRIAVATMHPLLSLNDDTVDFYNLHGVKRVLESQGFATEDILLKDRGQPTVNTYEENLFENLDRTQTLLLANIEFLKKNLHPREVLEELRRAEEELKRIEMEVLTRAELAARFKAALEGMNQKYIYAPEPGAKRLSFMTRAKYEELRKKNRLTDDKTSHVDEEDVARELVNHDIRQLQKEQFEAKLKKIQEEQKNVKIEELDLAERRRLTDMRLKLSRLFADSDLLVISRVTLTDIPKGEEFNVPNQFHRLSDEQFAAVKEFLKAGKPVLFCLGPSNEESRAPLLQADQVEELLEELGFKLPVQTILFDSELDSFAQQRGSLLVAGVAKVELPRVEFSWPSTPTAAPHEIRTSVGLMAKSLGPQSGQAYKLRHNRPVYFVKPLGPREAASIPSAFAAVGNLWTALALTHVQMKPRLEETTVLMAANRLSWNEDKPFPNEDRPTPRYEPSKAGDPNHGTLLERRRGPFPIAAAVEVGLPSEWYLPRDTVAGRLKLADSKENSFTLTLASGEDRKFLVDPKTQFVDPRRGDRTTGRAGLRDERTAQASELHVVVADDGKTAREVYWPFRSARSRLAVVGNGNAFTGKDLNPVQQKLLLDLVNWLLDRRLLAQEGKIWQFPRVELGREENLLWQWGTRLGLPLMFVYLGGVMALFRRMR